MCCIKGIKSDSTNSFSQRRKPDNRGYENRNRQCKTFKRTLDKFAIGRNGTETEDRTDSDPGRYTSQLFADSTSPAAADSDRAWVQRQDPRASGSGGPHMAQLYDIGNHVIVDCIPRVAATNGDVMPLFLAALA